MGLPDCVVLRRTGSKRKPRAQSANREPSFHSGRSIFHVGIHFYEALQRANVAEGKSAKQKKKKKETKGELMVERPEQISRSRISFPNDSYAILYLSPNRFPLPPPPQVFFVSIRLISCNDSSHVHVRRRCPRKGSRTANKALTCSTT